MRLSAKILLGFAGVTAVAVVASIGCGVDSDRFEGIGNEVPNSPYGRPIGTTTSGTTSTVSQTGGSSGNPCQCAAIIFAPDAGECGKCSTDVVSGTGPCLVYQAECNADDAGACQTALTNAAQCAATADPSTCMEGVLVTNTTLQKLLSCQCGATLCKSKCQVADPISCNIGTTTPDAGDDGGDGGDAGDGGP